MLLETTTYTTPEAPARRLLVADWTVDPRDVVASAARLDGSRPGELAVLVPAWLHGIDWAGDPAASAPCARRQLESIRQRAAEAGFPIATAAVGDPDPATAILDALAGWPADEVVLCVRHRRLPAGPFDLARRARRLTGLSVRRVAITPPSSRVARGWFHRRSAHCGLEAAQPA